MKSRLSRIWEIIKDRPDINEIKNKQQIKLTKSKVGSLKIFVKLINKSYLEKTKITTNIRLEREDVTTDPTEVTG